MTIGLGVATAYLTVLTVRLVRSSDLRLSPFRLKESGRVTAAGGVFTLIVLLYGLFFAHSGFIRYHEVRGLKAIETIKMGLATSGAVPPGAIETALSHLQVVDRWGLYLHPVRDHQLADLYLKSGTPAAAEPYLQRIVDRDRGRKDIDSRLAFVQLLIQGERLDEAVDQAADLLAVGAEVDPQAYLAMGGMFAESGRLEAAEEHFRRAIELRPDSAHAYFNLGRIQEQRGQTAQAEENYRLAASLDESYAGITRRP
jgi:hypothetical protein